MKMKLAMALKRALKEIPTLYQSEKSTAEKFSALQQKTQTSVKKKKKQTKN